MKKRVQGADEMADCANEFVVGLAPRRGAATVVALSGELGAGKTTFAQAAARALGVDEHVASPTFVIEKIYALSGQKFARLIHIDAYRLHSADELRALGWDEMLRDSGNLIIIEWPENVSDVIPERAYRISIGIDGNSERSLQISGLQNR